MGLGGGRKWGESEEASEMEKTKNGKESEEKEGVMDEHSKP